MAMVEKQNNSILDIINNLSAEMVGISVPDYVKTHEELVEYLYEIRDKVEESVVCNMETYTKAYKIKGILSSLCCYCFNNDYKEWYKVIEIENIIGNKLISFIRKYKKITPNQRKLGRYALWSYKFKCDKKVKIVQDLLNADMLRFDDEGHYYIIGFHLSVGDNTFRTSANNVQCRNYVPVCCFMAIDVSSFMIYFLKKGILDNFDIPTLENYYHKYSVGNHRRGVRISMNREDREYIMHNYLL